MVIYRYPYRRSFLVQRRGLRVKNKTNPKNSVEFFPSRSSGALRAAYTLENLARALRLVFAPLLRGILAV
ncbi:MAG: hypothetical protein A2270_04790 [Elusimicrobia bacterium RIFOXYA12_FULL_51_18]|nr:MAG: hypothetical protein A2270_04790 [Elusimicrobia bacterium RIFOXYA12_FULL_51_18]OGS32914.1 MAG: hypothetical protein A2218_10970 [Elusimicrobia bacterium RIFOXYA2_FULL_53_38]